MAKNIKLKDGSTVRYLDDKDISSMIDQLLSDKVLGSSVLPKNASEADKIKFKLCSKIVEFKLKHGVTQKELAEKLGFGRT